MISIENREAFAKAEAKAKLIKPRVTIVQGAPFGTYSVAGSQGKDYTVTFQKLSGHWAASCTCPAHVADGRPDYLPKPCYHLPAAYSAFRLHFRMRQEIRASIEQPAWPPAVAAQEPEPAPPTCECGQNAFAFYNEHWYCIDCVKEAMRDGLESLGELDEATQWEKTEQAAEAEAERDAVAEMHAEYTAEMAARDTADIFG